jgi:hypothetical protein
MKLILRTLLPFALAASLHAALPLVYDLDASSFAGGLVIESRPALGVGKWSRVRTLGAGSTATLPLEADGRLYRVVQGP